MAFNIFGGNSAIRSPEQLAERRALVQALMARNMAQGRSDMWGGINALVGAVGGRIAENRLDKVEAEGRAGAGAAFAALKQALVNKQMPDTAMLTDVLSNEWTNPSQRSLAQGLYDQQFEANQPLSPYEKARLALEEREFARPSAATKPGLHQGVAPATKPAPENVSAQTVPDASQNEIMNEPQFGGVMNGRQAAVVQHAPGITGVPGNGSSSAEYEGTNSYRKSDRLAEIERQQSSVARNETLPFALDEIEQELKRRGVRYG